jgi:acylphosphatase
MTAEPAAGPPTRPAERRRRFAVRGRVQGVGFRAFVLREAHALGLRGFTRNLFDGGVEVVAVGDESDVQRLVQRLHVGPPLARVESVDRTPIDPLPDVAEFQIRG